MVHLVRVSDADGKRVIRLSRRYRNIPYVCILLVAVNVIVFFLSLLGGNVWHYLGGVQRTGIVLRHEYGRLLWAMFLHADTAHLFNNMIVLFFLGAMIEEEVGHICIAVVYFVSGIGGNVVSLIGKVMSGSNSLSIGASGAVFGLTGLLLALVLFLPGYQEKVSLVRVALLILLSLYDGFARDSVDYMAHLGGCVVGFLAGSGFVLARNLWRRKTQQIITD